ncbi:esterase [Lampropedia puyangensis]|uniref:Esterase n=1 Tax=Lampropedia puyangensis TaxID=1330072 RepID=A0A4S8F5Z8_9BURK|nr:YqiA/YcfP family alpha/beta fold hydrolase [Lampropedia puyangensis]THU02517.1 esterase [Lampropedia puyangensis]
MHAETTHLTHLLYLHGFRSSPQSAKAQQTRAWFATNYPEVVVEIPALPPSPHEAAQFMQAILNNWPQRSLAVMGSSLGGYYASWVSAQWHCPAVLLNPAVNPARDLQAYIGEQTAWHNPEEAFYFKPEYIEQLRELDCANNAATAPQLALIAQGDEVLDWQEMVQRYPHAKRIVLEGSNHALSDTFESHLPEIADFLYRLGQPASAI